MKTKKKLLALFAVAFLLVPTLAFAGSATDAALGLGAFAVFNQILAGTGIFGGLIGAPVPVTQPVVVAPPPPVYVLPAPVYAPPPVVVAPAPVYVPAPPVVVARPPRFVAEPRFRTRSLSLSCWILHARDSAREPRKISPNLARTRLFISLAIPLRWHAIWRS